MLSNIRNQANDTYLLRDTRILQKPAKYMNICIVSDHCGKMRILFLTSHIIGEILVGESTVPVF